MGKNISVNIEKCMACKNCEIACAVAHSKTGILQEAMLESPRPKSRVSVEAAGKFAVPMQCRHCEDAPCITVCPTLAIHRDGPNEPVLISQDKCIGCKFCLMACPFGVIEISTEDEAIVKCDLCIEKTKLGEPPACVQACPTGALTLLDTSEIATTKRKAAANEIALSAEQGRNQKLKEKTQ